MFALNIKEISYSEIKPGKIYRIKEIYSGCEWYSFRKCFEGKPMKCVETFEGESAWGFQFVDPADCPEPYMAELAFCFTRVKVSQ